MRLFQLFHTLYRDLYTKTQAERYIRVFIRFLISLNPAAEQSFQLEQP